MNHADVDKSVLGFGIVASRADGFAGLSALSGGGGAAAQPARRPKAINAVEYRFMICPYDRFQKLGLELHSAEIRDVLLGPLAGRHCYLVKVRPCVQESPNGDSCFEAQLWDSPVQ